MKWRPRFRFDRDFAFIGALIVLALGLVIGVINESAVSDRKLRELDTEAKILAQSVVASVMFSDQVAARESALAFSQNPEVDAVGVYEQGGALIASFSREGAEALPPRPTARASAYRGGFLETIRTVERDGQTYGHVYLRLRREPLLARLGRYTPLALLVLMTALVLAVAGAAQGALKRAYAQLEQKAADLEAANSSLKGEIDQRKSAEEALVQSRKMEAIGQLTGGVAHDFNNLLMVVSGGLRMLTRHDDPERRRNIMEAMQQAVERGAGLTRQLLSFARRQPVELQTISVAARINGMRSLLERSLRADILLDINIPEDLPPVSTDPGQLELAVLNLCVNARDAMQKGGVITISARLGSRLRTVEVLVRDTGAGIPPEILSRIFEPYFTTKPLGQGTGLGLSQVYGFAQQSGGEARIESQVGFGTTVILSLPISSEQLSAPSPNPLPVAIEDRSRHVLVVEDDDQVASTVCSMFEDLGHQTTRASSAEEALSALQRNHAFDLVFSDIVMPGGQNGIELARELERIAPNLPVLLTTGYSGHEDVDPGRPVLRKPYEIGDLREALFKVLNRRAAA
ncbi:MAG: response regulator [Hyphomonadaceae bacterium]|nr:response regulator [Hyphomonadaceae bacterium]